MPVLPRTRIKPPIHYLNEHFETIIPSLWRNVDGVHYERIRLFTTDDDFIDVDTLTGGHTNKAVVLSHGLEGSSDRPYIKGMAKIFRQAGWDVYAWNCRSCSGEMNKQLRLYHHGDIEDLSLVINHVLHDHDYEEVVIVGFSMGGSMTIRYAGTKGEEIDERIGKAIAFSVPTDLGACSRELEKRGKRMYKRRFLTRLTDKIERKAEQYPDKIDLSYLEKIDFLKDFDEYYTAPMYGFEDADDFYKKASSGPFVPKIRIPTLLVNALNDPFLPESCYPFSDAEDSDHVHLEVTSKGGHVGFIERGKKFSWAERRALEFAEKGK